MKNVLIVIGLLILVLGSCKEAENQREAIEDYLIENDLPFENVQNDLYRVISKEGTGASPEAGASVNLTYVGSYIDGTVFDSGAGTFDLDNWVEGLQIGIPLMKRGGKSTFLFTSELGYGSRGYLSIPGNTPLIFDIELIDF